MKTAMTGYWWYEDYGGGKEIALLHKDVDRTMVRYSGKVLRLSEFEKTTGVKRWIGKAIPPDPVVEGKIIAIEHSIERIIKEADALKGVLSRLRKLVVQ